MHKTTWDIKKTRAWWEMRVYLDKRNEEYGLIREDDRFVELWIEKHGIYYDSSDTIYSDSDVDDSERGEGNKAGEEAGDFPPSVPIDIWADSRKEKREKYPKGFYIFDKMGYPGYGPFRLEKRSMWNPPHIEKRPLILGIHWYRRRSNSGRCNHLYRIGH